ncbi:hypothetical protein P7C70_g8323, partial [Phenoliferia sp. Uapishka_3]
MSQSQDEEVNNRVEENENAYEAMRYQSLQAIEDGEPPARLFQTTFKRSLHILAALCQVLLTPNGTLACEAAFIAARKAILDETGENSLGRLFWSGRFDAVVKWIEAGDDSDTFTSHEYTCSNEQIDKTRHVKQSAKVSENEGVSGLEDPKGVLSDARTLAHDAALMELQELIIRNARYDDEEEEDDSPPSDHASQHSSNSGSGHAAALEDYERSLVDLNEAPFGEDYMDGNDSSSDIEVIDDEPISRSRATSLARRIAPLPLASRLSALAITPPSKSGSGIGASIRRKPGTNPSKEESRRLATSTFLADAIRPSPRRKAKSKRAADIFESDTEEDDSDRDAEKSSGDEFDIDAVDSHQQALDDMYAHHLEPTGSMRTGSAFRTFNRAQYIRAYNPKRFKAIIGSLQYAMHTKAMESCARNERWDFESLNAYDSMPEAELSAIASLPGVFTSDASRSSSVSALSGILGRKRGWTSLFSGSSLDSTKIPPSFKTTSHSSSTSSRKSAFQASQLLCDTPSRIHLDSSFILMRQLDDFLKWERAQDQERKHRREEQRKRKRSATNGTTGRRLIPVAASMFAMSVDRTSTESTTVPTWEEMERINEEKGRRGPTELPRLPQESEDLPTDSFPLAGTSSIPKLSRSLHFPTSDRPRTPSVDSTLTDPPLPSVPLCVLNDPIINATLQARPDLFKVSTPINIPRFRRLLANHPNRPLIDSVLHGLEHGFWPGHDGDFSKISHLSGSAPNLDDDELDFLTESALSDYEKGYFSESFDKLLPGMHISPSYVTNTENQRRRQICDQTGSGLNDGVSRDIARVRYDAQQELGAVARWRHRRGELQAPHAKPVWWKSDDAPKIFCTVMSLILWATRYELFLEFPLAFVDDAFGIDCSGVRAQITHHSGESRLVPSEQAKVLEMWNYVGMPWDWKKQPSSSSLVIIGNLFTIHDDFNMSISLAASSIEKFDISIQSFLSHPSGRRPLKEWLHIQGYANWAVGVFPWGKFALQCLYEKTAGKTMMGLGVSINDVVKRDLSWFIEELRASPPLSLLDPSLDHWGVNDADIVLYTDACLTSDQGSTSGLGFWTRYYGHKSCFYSRLSPPLTDIRWAEALAVFSAINWALDNTSARRILIFTDSALCVYAIDSGKIPLGPMHDLVWSLYARLAAKGVDLRRPPHPSFRRRYCFLLPALGLAWRAFAIDCFGAGFDTPAPLGRRKRPKTPPLSQVRFNPIPSSPSSSTRAKKPPPSIEKLTALMEDLILNSLATGTRRGYKSSMKHWITFVKVYHLDPTPTEISLPLFAAFLSQRVKHPNKVLSAMASHFKPLMKNWEEIRNSYAIQQVLTGASKQPQEPTKRSPPLLPSHLVAFVERALRPGASYDDLLFAFIAALGFCGIMRLGDGLIEYDHKEDRSWRKVIKRSSVILEPGVKVEFFLPYHKGDRFYRGNTVILKPENSPDDFSIVDLFQTYLRRRDALFPSNDRLLIRQNGKAPFRDWVVPLIRSIAPEVSGHGLRAGGATWLAMRGVPADIIKRLGRWTSDQWEIYIRDHPDLSAAIAMWVLRLHQ